MLPTSGWRWSLYSSIEAFRPWCQFRAPIDWRCHWRLIEADSTPDWTLEATPSLVFFSENTTHKLLQIQCQHGLRFHWYANDTHTIHRPSPQPPISPSTKCLKNVNTHCSVMVTNYLAIWMQQQATSSSSLSEADACVKLDKLQPLTSIPIRG